MGNNCCSPLDDDEYKPAEQQANELLDEFYEFLNSDAVHDFTTGDYEDIRNNFNYVSENLLALVEQAKERKIERNELIEAMPKTKEAVDILTYLKEIRYDFGLYFAYKNRKEGNFRWSKLYSDINSIKREKPELEVPELKGVSWFKQYKSFASRVEHGNNTYWLGLYSDRYSAARAYDEKLRDLISQYPDEEKDLRELLNFDEEEKKWWYKTSERDMKMGPYSWRDIEEKIAANVLTPRTLVSDQKYSKDWLMLAEIQSTGVFDDRNKDPRVLKSRWESY